MTTWARLILYYHVIFTCSSVTRCHVCDMSLIKPSGRKGPVSSKAGGRRNGNDRTYACPLPLTFLYPPPSPARSLFGLLGISLTKVETPQCHGVFDPATL